MFEQTERISFRISSVLSKVEPEPELDLHTGSARLRYTAITIFHLSIDLF